MTSELDAAYVSLMQFLYRAPIGLVQTALDGNIEMINPMSANLLMPLSRDGGLDNLFTVLGGVAPRLREMVTAFAPPSGLVCEAVRIPLASVGGSGAAPQVLSVSILKLDEARLMVALIDVTLQVQHDQRRLARRLNAAARVDNLTRMPIRAVVLERLQQAMARASIDAGYEFAVLFMNCDRFTQINDTLGHAAGDEVLGMMADRLRATLRLRDEVGRPAGDGQLVARIGGDEFVVLLDDLRRLNDVHAVALRCLEVLAKPYGVGSHQVLCHMSMGIVLREQAMGDADAVLQDASIAMVEAKHAGGARYLIFEPAMRERVALRGIIEADLQCALAGGQMFVVYQPVVGLQGPDRADGSVDRSTGMEALVRWRHPTRGLVGPVEFIGIAEECGVICALGDFVLATACRQFVAWQAELGPRAPRTLAVNVSRAQLGQEGFVASVAATLRSTGMAPAQLQLEVTESLSAQGEVLKARLHELKALGLTLALDDFGTGYSSLSSLHLFPVDTVKIDRSFVCQVDTSHHHRVLVDATVRVAHSLGMTTVAEGIETEAQAAVVRELGCDKGQGYLFSKPLAAEDLPRWIVTGESRRA